MSDLLVAGLDGRAMSRLRDIDLGHPSEPGLRDIDLDDTTESDFLVVGLDDTRESDFLVVGLDDTTESDFLVVGLNDTTGSELQAASLDDTADSDLQAISLGTTTNSDLQTVSLDDTADEVWRECADVLYCTRPRSSARAWRLSALVLRRYPGALLVLVPLAGGGFLVRARAGLTAGCAAAPPVESGPCH